MGRRSVAATVIAMLVMTATSCVKEEPIPGGSGNRALPVEVVFADQAKAVAEGRSSKIYVRQQTVDDAHLLRAEGLESLEVLNLPNSVITDQGLSLLAGLPKLMLLRLSTPHLTDAGMAEIAKIKSLRFLHLIDVPITDAGLEHLQGMTQLESFYLDGSKATDEGIEQLLKALPELHFHKDQQHLPGDPQAHEHK